MEGRRPESSCHKSRSQLLSPLLAWGQMTTLQCNQLTREDVCSHLLIKAFSCPRVECLTARLSCCKASMRSFRWSRAWLVPCTLHAHVFAHQHVSSLHQSSGGPGRGYCPAHCMHAFLLISMSSLHQAAVQHVEYVRGSLSKDAHRMHLKTGGKPLGPPCR